MVVDAQVVRRVYPMAVCVIEHVMRLAQLGRGAPDGLGHDGGVPEDEHRLDDPGRSGTAGRAARVHAHPGGTGDRPLRGEGQQIPRGGELAGRIETVEFAAAASAPASVSGSAGPATCVGIDSVAAGEASDELEGDADPG